MLGDLASPEVGAGPAHLGDGPDAALTGPLGIPISLHLPSAEQPDRGVKVVLDVCAQIMMLAVLIAARIK